MSNDPSIYFFMSTGARLQFVSDFEMLAPTRSGFKFFLSADARSAPPNHPIAETLTVAANSGSQPIGIAAPSDPYFVLG